MKFSVGDVILAGDKEYLVIGAINYMNMIDRNCWDEYRLKPTGHGVEAWLSVDDVFGEYSISWVRSSKPSFKGYHLVDEGQEKVLDTDGMLDVSVGDTAKFSEFEDENEEKIISEELWSDGPEYSTGVYLRQSDIIFIRHDDEAYKAEAKRRKRVMIVFLVLFFFIPLLACLLGFILDITGVSDGEGSNSIRQGSLRTHMSDGGGLSSGK